MKKITLVLICVSLILVFFVYSGRSSETIKLTTEDKEKIKATYYPPPSQNAPGVILIPDTRCDRDAFGRLPSKFNKAGFAVLVMDLRYKELIASAKGREGKNKLSYF